MRALGYFRIDSAEQVEDCEKSFWNYCEAHNHQTIETFVDTTSETCSSYPEYEKLIEYIRQSGSAFLVVIPDATHIGENLEAVIRTFLHMESAGAKIVCQDEDMPDPIQGALSILGVGGVSKARSGRVREAMQDKAMQGKSLGRPPFGYRNGEDGTLSIVPEEASVVQLIFRLYTRDEMGMRLIVQHLNEREITTRRGGKWSVVSIREILRNTVYMGTYTRFGLRLPRSHEPIIDPKIFRKARDIARSRKPFGRVSRAMPFLLSGLVFCDYCGNKMMGVTRHQRWKNKSGGRKRNTYRYYQCQSRNNQSVCGYHTWREADLEGAVLAQIPMAAQAKQFRKASGSSRDLSSEEELGRIWEERAAAAERRFTQAIRKVASGAAKTDLLQRALTDLDNARAGAQRIHPPAEMDETLQKWDEIEFDEKRDFLLTHVGRIDVKDHMATVVL